MGADKTYEMRDTNYLYALVFLKNTEKKMIRVLFTWFSLKGFKLYIFVHKMSESNIVWTENIERIKAVHHHY